MSAFSYETLYRAYLDCRKNKRNKPDALLFETHAEDHLHDLCVALKERSYRPSSSICFAAQKPKLREIFAADFRDRIAHHLLVRYLENIWEPIFIFDSYASRQGKGIHLAAKRLKIFMRKVSCNQTSPAFYMQLDIRNFFMSIDKIILYDLIRNRCPDADMLWLAKIIIFHDPTADYHLKSPRSLIRRIPRQKSLFGNPEDKGLPIGNLTSQFFANIYLNGLDQFVKHRLKCRFYMRYVDDFILADPSRETLLGWKQKTVAFLDSELRLALNPRRSKLQPVQDGADFLGYIIRPDYILIRNRVVNNLKTRLGVFERKLTSWQDDNIRIIRYDDDVIRELFACLSSYLAHFRHGNAHTLTRRIFEKNAWLSHYFSFEKKRLKRLYRPPKRFSRLRIQYYHFLNQFPDDLIFFQKGCFYEFYGPQAHKAMRCLNLKRIRRKHGFRNRCGIGEKSLHNYVEQALENGCSVIVIRQTGYLAGRIAERLPVIRFVREEPKQVSGQP